jgi:hypothetical protein
VQGTCNLLLLLLLLLLLQPAASCHQGPIDVGWHILAGSRYLQCQ